MQLSDLGNFSVRMGAGRTDQPEGQGGPATDSCVIDFSDLVVVEDVAPRPVRVQAAPTKAKSIGESKTVASAPEDAAGDVGRRRDPGFNAGISLDEDLVVEEAGGVDPVVSPSETPGPSQKSVDIHEDFQETAIPGRDPGQASSEKGVTTQTVDAPQLPRKGNELAYTRVIDRTESDSVASLALKDLIDRMPKDIRQPLAPGVARAAGGDLSQGKNPAPHERKSETDAPARLGPVPSSSAPVPQTQAQDPGAPDLDMSSGRSNTAGRDVASITPRAPKNEVETSWHKPKDDRIPSVGETTLPETAFDTHRSSGRTVSEHVDMVRPAEAPTPIDRSKPRANLTKAPMPIPDVQPLEHASESHTTQRPHGEPEPPGDGPGARVQAGPRLVQPPQSAQAFAFSAGVDLPPGADDAAERPEAILTESARWQAAGDTGAPSQTRPVMTTASLPPDLGAQIRRALVRSDGQVTELELSPRELGMLRIRVTTTDMGAQLQLSADRPETFDLLRRHLDQLERQLHGMGFSGMNLGQHGAHRAYAGPKADPEGESRKSEPGAETLAHRPAAADRLGASGLDMRI